jgi:argininosuccinate lyase (EC 4.3.2.1)
MPQKRNPDAAELVRAKAGRIIGDMNALLIIMKGLPLAYQKDMQEDKEQAFDCFESLSLVLAAMTGMVDDLVPNVARMAAAAGSGFSTATDLADWLVRVLGLPFRDAHHVTGRLVAIAAERGIELSDIPLADMKTVHDGITEAVYDVLTVEIPSAAARRMVARRPTMCGQR